MRRFILIALLTFISFASCKKDHTCTCTVTPLGGIFSIPSIEEKTFRTKTIAEAEQDCEEFEDEMTTHTDSAHCVLK
ncbi:MAG TPA: hypothetical protein VFF27_19125 [Bacteroidia bacterium]|jgi:hypothetical protein|nr:hypothetical protein [Bacteroidia bacterium]